MRAGVFDLAFQSCQIGRRHAMVLRNDHVAGAKKAKVLAKRQVHVNRSWRMGRLSLLVSVLQVIRAEIVAPHRRGRVACIAWSRTVVQSKKFGRNAESLMLK